MNRGHIVVIDDSEVWRELARHALNRAGYSVSVLPSAFALSTALRQEFPDLVLVDVSMPALSGDKVIEVARRHQLTRCKLILFSDRPTSELAKLVQSSGADAFIQKTPGAAGLASEVDRLLHPV